MNLARSAVTGGTTVLSDRILVRITAERGQTFLDRMIILVEGAKRKKTPNEVCKRIRAWSDVPIVVLSADGSEDRKVGALDDGADDYMTKPFGMRELNARLRVAFRHHKSGDGEQAAQIDVGPLHLDLAHYEATYAGRQLDLAPKEFAFLAYLARHAGKVCTRKMILANVWGPSYARELHYLKVYAYRIRRKLHDEGGKLLQSDPSVGYRLAAPGD